jgi:hypothetical protein
MWIVAMVGATIVSAFSIRHTPRGTEFAFEIRTIAALFLALTWLPSLLRVIALTGGGVKAAGGEVTTGGLADLFRSLPEDERDEPLANTIAALQDVEARVPPGRRPEAKRIRDELEGELATVLTDADTPEEFLIDQANRYEELRRRLPSSYDRTFEMTKIVARCRSVASRLANRVITAARFFERGSEGGRIVALAIAQAQPDPRLFDLCVDALARPHSAFEQFNALLALQQLVPMLSRSQRERLRVTLNDQRQGNESEGKWINRSDMSRWMLSTEILEAL